MAQDTCAWLVLVSSLFVFVHPDTVPNNEASGRRRFEGSPFGDGPGHPILADWENILFSDLRPRLRINSQLSTIFVPSDVDFDPDGRPGVVEDFKIEVGPGREEYFFQRMENGTRLYISFQVNIGSVVRACSVESQFAD